MPEHVHLLVTEPEQAKLSVALQMLKQNVARQLREVEGGSLWQARYYDFNVWTEAKRIEKLRYIHRNPVSRGLVSSPELWLGVAFDITFRALRAWLRLSRSGLLEREGCSGSRLK